MEIDYPKIPSQLFSGLSCEKLIRDKSKKSPEKNKIRAFTSGCRPLFFA